MIIELEDNIGNTIGAIQFERNIDGTFDIINNKGDISFADMDFDDIFDTNDLKYRICLENVKPKNSNKSFEHSIW